MYSLEAANRMKTINLNLNDAPEKLTRTFLKAFCVIFVFE